MAHLLGGESLHLEYPTKVVFDSVTLGIAEGDRIGIVGRNGDGKSTLLGMLAGLVEPDGGRVTVRGGVRVGVLDQADTLADDDTIRSAVVGDRPEHEWAGDARTRDVLAGLLGDLPWESRLGDLSGGQRRRVALAHLLAQDWDVMFLDEPTNHLDVEAITWLAGHLKRRWPAGSGGLLVVTHDRWFLDEVCTMTWEVHDRIVEAFEGGYAAYILQRVERDRMAASSEAQTAEPRPQGAGVAPPRGAGTHLQAPLPHRRRERAHRGRARDPRQDGAAVPRPVPPRQRRRRPPRRRRHLRRPHRPARCRVAHRAGGAHRHPRRQRRGQVHAPRPGGRFARSHRGPREARQDRQGGDPDAAPGRARGAPERPRARRAGAPAHQLLVRHGLEDAGTHARSASGAPRLLRRRSSPRRSRTSRAGRSAACSCCSSCSSSRTC